MAKATTLGTLIATVVYILSTVSIMGMIPAAQLKTSVTPFADAAVLIWGHGAAYWVSAGCYRRFWGPEWLYINTRAITICDC